MTTKRACTDQSKLKERNELGTLAMGESRNGAKVTSGALHGIADSTVFVHSMCFGSECIPWHALVAIRCMHTWCNIDFILLLVVFLEQYCIYERG